MSPTAWPTATRQHNVVPQLTNFHRQTRPFDEHNLPTGTHHIDMLKHICPEGVTTDSSQCPVVIGNIIVWYDGSHLTNQHVATLIPRIGTELQKKPGGYSINK